MNAFKAKAKEHTHYRVERLRHMHNTAISVNVKIKPPVGNDSSIGELYIRTARLIYRTYSYRPFRSYRNNKQLICWFAMHTALV